MKKVGTLLVNSAIRVLEAFSSAASPAVRSKAASFLSAAIFLFSAKRRNIACGNLRMAFPDKSEAEIKKTARQSLANIALTYLELIIQRRFKEEDVKRFIHFENSELINRAAQKGKGVILLSGHYGNWELLACAAGLYSAIPVLIIVQKQKFWDKEITESRVRFGNTVVERGSAARKIVGTLRSGGAVALLADQSPPRIDGIFSDFFGVSTLTYKAPAELSLKFGSPIIAGFAVRKSNGTYSVRLEEIGSDGLEYNDEGIAELTQRCNKLLEDNIRRHPHLWAWPHRRWKVIQEKNEGNDN